MTKISQDLRYSVRMLLKSPGFAAIVVITLALGIGANTALFSVVNGVLLNPLSYPHSEQLVAVYGTAPGFSQGPASYLNFLDWQHNNQTFSSMATYRNQDYNITDSTEAQRVSGYMVSADFFSTLNGTSYTVIGVVPAAFTFYGHDRDVYTPIGQWNNPSFRDRRISVSARVIGRLKSDISLAEAKADMDLVARNLAAAYPVADKDVGIALVSMKDDIVGNVQPFLLVLIAAVGFLLLIACANVANLLLVRAMDRSREFVVRAALGASHMRVVRQLFTESILLAGLGGALGLLLAFYGTKAVLNTLPGTLPRANEIALDGRVLLFSIALSLFAAIIFGLAPALKSSQVNLQDVLREGGRGFSSARHRLQRIFVAVELAMALVLLIGAGLMLRSLSAIWRVNPGYNPSHAITFNLSTPSTSATTSDQTRARLRLFDDKMHAVPGVQAVSVTLGSRPMIHDSSLPFWIEGEPKPSNDNDMHQAMFYLVEAGFQQAMGITLQRGRFVTPDDKENTPVVIDIDDAFARTYFPHENPIGKHVNLTQFNVRTEIVGVVGHIKQWGPGADETGAVQAQFFYPFMQLPEKLMPLAAGGVAVVLRTQGDPAAVMSAVRDAVAQIDRRIVIYGVQTLDDVITASLAARRLTMILLSGFAGLALVLSCIGIYGVISYLVGQRTREIGVRMALGAQRRDVLRLVLGQGFKMALVGTAVGIVAALGLTRLMASQLFGITAHDPLTFAAVGVVLFLVALLACYLPARRAVRVDPIVALRYE